MTAIRDIGIRSEKEVQFPSGSCMLYDRLQSSTDENEFGNVSPSDRHRHGRSIPALWRPGMSRLSRRAILLRAAYVEEDGYDRYASKRARENSQTPTINALEEVIFVVIE